MDLKVIPLHMSDKKTKRSQLIGRKSDNDHPESGQTNLGVWTLFCTQCQRAFYEI